MRIRAENEILLLQVIAKDEVRKRLLIGEALAALISLTEWLTFSFCIRDVSPQGHFL